MSKITRNHIFFVIFIGLAVLSFGGYVLTGTWIKKFGFTVMPSEQGKFISPKYKLLEELPIPTDLGIENIRNSWMLASSLNASGINVSVQEINRSLADSGFYTENTDFQWKRLNKAVPQASFYFRRIFGGSTLVKELKSGRLPIIKVKNNNTKSTDKETFRWLLLVGWDSKEFLIFDPLRLPDIKPVPLSGYGRIYGYRVLYRVVAI